MLAPLIATMQNVKRKESSKLELRKFIYVYTFHGRGDKKDAQLVEVTGMGGIPLLLLKLYEVETKLRHIEDCNLTKVEYY